MAKSDARKQQICGNEPAVIVLYIVQLIFSAAILCVMSGWHVNV